MLSMTVFKQKLGVLTRGRAQAWMRYEVDMKVPILGNVMSVTSCLHQKVDKKILGTFLIHKWGNSILKTESKSYLFWNYREYSGVALPLLQFFSCLPIRLGESQKCNSCFLTIFLPAARAWLCITPVNQDITFLLKCMHWFEFSTVFSVWLENKR